jgi:N utilization substance protein B
MGRLAVMDKVLLRMGIVELLYFDDIPVNVTINEYVELGRQFSTDHSASFLNGMLDAIGKALAANGQITKRGRGRA